MKISEQKTIHNKFTLGTSTSSTSPPPNLTAEIPRKSQTYEDTIFTKLNFSDDDVNNFSSSQGSILKNSSKKIIKLKKKKLRNKSFTALLDDFLTNRNRGESRLNSQLAVKAQIPAEGESILNFSNFKFRF